VTAGDYAEVYRDGSGEYRTRILAGNHEVIFDSAEGYENKTDALAMVATRFPEVSVVDLTENE